MSPLHRRHRCRACGSPTARLPLCGACRRPSSSVDASTPLPWAKGGRDEIVALAGAHGAGEGILGAQRALCGPVAHAPAQVGTETGWREIVA